MINGQRIKDIIANKGLTQKEAFTKANIKEGTFYSLFRESANPGSDIIELLAKALECSIDDFFDIEVENKASHIGHSVSGKGNNVSGDILVNEYRNEIESLKLRLEEKDKVLAILEERIKDKDEMIVLLKQQLNITS